jgi:hypothetical protein
MYMDCARMSELLFVEPFLLAGTPKLLRQKKQGRKKDF